MAGLPAGINQDARELPMRYPKSLLMGCVLTAQLLGAAAHAGELQDAMARFEITELMYKYALVHNLTEPEEYAALFTKDGAFVTGGVVSVKGRDALVALGKKDRETYNPGAAAGKRSFMVMRTIITNPLVTLNSDGSADGICYMQIVVQKAGVGPQILAQGRYEDKFRKEEGKWKIARREVFLDMTNMGLAKEVGVIK
jgi:SnoaL-like domain